MVTGQSRQTGQGQPEWPNNSLQAWLPSMPEAPQPARSSVVAGRAMPRWRRWYTLVGEGGPKPRRILGDINE